MPKLVIEAKIREKPINNSILVYDEKLEAFVETNKDDFFKERDNKIKELEKVVKQQDAELKKFGNQLSLMAKTIKERVI